MKLLRIGALGQEKPAMLDDQGLIRDLSQHIQDITGDTLSPNRLTQLKKIDPYSLPVISAGQRIGTPYAHTGKFFGVGMNYKDHALETGSPIPNEPIVFYKWCAPTGPNDPVILPKNSTKTDWEVELGIVIGTQARCVSLETALDYVAGYCVVNDISEREYQMERGGTWDKGKGFDTFGPIGPWLVTADEVGDPQNLNLWLDVNGKRYQTGNTRSMIFNVAFLVHYISQIATLNPGDLITTGTPPGVGLGLKPPRYLQPGDVMHLGIERLGEQRQDVIAWHA